MICDYIDPIDPPSAPILCEIQGRDTLPIGFSRKYSAVFFNSENQPDNMVEAIWSIVDLPIGINFEINSNTITINASEEISLIGERFKIMVSDESGRYNGTKHVEVTG